VLQFFHFTFRLCYLI